MRRIVVLLLVVAGALAAVRRWPELTTVVPSHLLPTPHARYAAVQYVKRAFGSDQAEAWLAASESALARPEAIAAPFSAEGSLDGTAARAWRFSVRRGQRVVIDLTHANPPAFVDLFRGSPATLVASSPRDSSHLQHDADGDGELVLRVQPALDRGGRFELKAALVPSLTFPVRGVRPASVSDSFGAARDGGRRSHAGVDIFAPRGTPVVAAADGWVRGSTTNGLGGNVVWLWSPLRRLSTYYAHLDAHAVPSGARVREGDVVGYVGTTGNARGTPPHLHFGVYTWDAGAVDPLPYLRVTR